jgi:Arc/MetJ-type ribon-helix-helix transcriptional regulator
LEVVSIRVDEQLKRRMEHLRYVNWSEVIRSAISAKIREEEQRERSVDPELLLRAKVDTDRLRRPSPGWNSTEEIRKWRNQRR